MGFLSTLAAALQISARAADVTATWTNAVSGNWNTNGNWTNAPLLGGFPNNGNGGVATYDAVISATGAAYTVTNGTSITLEDLSISSANATLNHTAGVFTATNGIAVSAGALQMNGGTISNTTINLSGTGSLTFMNAFSLLTGVTVNGELTLGPNTGLVKIEGGTTFATARITGGNSEMGFAPGSIMNSTILFAGAVANERYVSMNGTPGTFTIGASGVIRHEAGTMSTGVVGWHSFTNAFHGAMTLTNNGLISSQISGRTIDIRAASFTNAGTVEATNGGIMTVNSANWSNASTVRALTGGTVNLNGTWSNLTGALTADATSSLHLGGAFTTPNMGTLSLAAASQVRVTGAWNNSGQSFSINAGNGTWTLDGGTITGGTLDFTGGKTLICAGNVANRLNGVTVNGDLTMSESFAHMKIEGGTTFATARLTGGESDLRFAPGSTLNSTILVGGASNVIRYVSMNGTAGAFTIGATGVIRTEGGTVGTCVIGLPTNNYYPNGAMTLTNNGLISSQATGSSIEILAASFSNAGTLEATIAATINRPGGYTQTGGATRVTVGTITAQTASVNDLIQINGGALEGRGTINANVFVADTLNPTSGGGALGINGDLSLGTNAQLRFEIGGSGINAFDQLTEAGTAPLALDGMLRLTFANGFQNTITGGNTFTIISSNAPITGAFDNVASGSRLYTEDGHGSFIVTVSGNFVILSGYLPVPDIAVSGNNVNIADGDATPDLADHSDFASVSISGATRVRTFTITNTGLGALTLGNVTVSGAHAVDFTVTAQPASPFAPGGSTTFEVTFDPSDVGLRNAALSLITDDPDENPFNFSIQGTGALSNNADLSALTPSAGVLVPAFNPALTGYTIPLNYYVTSMTITPTKADVNASIDVRINGGGFASVVSGTPSGVLALNVGANTVDVRVTAEDGSTKTYTIAVSRSAPTAGDSDLVDFNVVGGFVAAAAVQPDGKTLIAGNFTSVLGQPRSHIARLNADGTLDTGFDPNSNNEIYSVVVQSDGKVLLGGSFTTIGGTARNRIARLNADGTLDTGFDPNANSFVSSLALQPDGKVVLGGIFTTMGGSVRNNIARVNADGTLDTGFDPNANSYVNAVALQADGKVLLIGNFTTLQPNGAASPTTRNRIARVNVDGTLDAGFDPNANLQPYCLVVQPDGKVLLGGVFTTVGGIARNRIARVNSNGTLDSSFDPNANAFVSSLAVQADGKVLFGGGFTTLQPNGAGAATTRNRVARVNADGTLDAGFNPNANVTVNGVALQADGKVLVGGYFTTLQPNLAVAPVSQNYFARLVNDPATQSLTIPSVNRVQWLRGGSSPETLSVSFELSLDGGTNYTLLGSGTRSIGGWELTGLALPAAGQIRARARTSGGYLSGSGGLVETVTPFSGLPVPDIAVSGNSINISNGDNSPSTIDHTNLGSVNVIGGAVTRTFTISNSGAAFLMPSSVLISGAHAADFTVIAQPDALVAPGNTTTLQITFDAINSGTRNAIVTIPNNDFDETPFTFSIRGTGIGPTPGDVDPLNAGIVGGAQPVVLSSAVQPDGKVIIGGRFTSVFGVPRNNVARLNADGTLDFGFDPNANDSVDCIGVQADGKVLLGGTYTALQPNGAGAPTTRNRIARVNADGTLDTGFDPDASSHVFRLALQPDGKVVLGGLFTTMGGTTRNYIARLNTNGTLDMGFDPKPNSSVYGVAVQPDGKILLGGVFTTLQPNGAGASTARQRIARVNGDGTLDTSFDPKANNIVYLISVQPDGKIVLGGSFTTLQPNGMGAATTRNRIARVNPDGMLDTGFDPNANGDVFCGALQTDGKVLLGGLFSNLQPNGASAATARPSIARVNADGTLDTGFNPRANNTVFSITLQADGKVLLGGIFSSLLPNGASASVARNLFARLLNDPASQSLTIPSTSLVQWQRGGTSPETHDVTFELTTNDGASYTALGAGTRITGGWERTGLSLPASGWVRSRARTYGGYAGGSGGLVERITAYGPDTTAIEFWRQFYFGSPANIGFGADTYDFDQDGLANLIEFAFGLDPTQGSSVLLPQPQISGGDFFVSFTGFNGITYSAEWSTTLQPASWSPIPDTGIAPQHIFSVPIGSNTRIFMRFVITNP